MKFFLYTIALTAIALVGTAQPPAKPEPSKIDQTLVTALIGAMIALAGFAGKSIIDWFKKQKALKQKKYAFLIELNSLLNASNDVFQKQREMRDNMVIRLKQRLHISFEGKKGYEKLITENWAQFNEDDNDLHAVIRGYTMALYDLNSAMLAWLKKDIYFKTKHGKKGALESFAEKLNLLESHLYLWIAKYNVWIPNNPKHALIYLADEGHHGTPFPVGIEKDIEQILSSDYL